MNICLLLAVSILALLPLAPAYAASPIVVVAAENFYGDIARQIGGSEVAVTSILSNPDQDPHLFEASPSAARAISAARVVVYNGIDYDPWMAKLLSAAGDRDRVVVVVAALTGRKEGDNPHVWYDPKTMPALAARLADELSRLDPAHSADYRRRLEAFRQSFAPVEAKIAALRDRFAGTPVTATEPLFGYLFTALGMPVRNTGFQLAVMNNTEPGASAIAAFENDLKARRVRLLVYNRQAAGPLPARMVALARSAHIPVVGASETQPAGIDYQAWIMSELAAVDRALTQ